MFFVFVCVHLLRFWQRRTRIEAIAYCKSPPMLQNPHFGIAHVEKNRGIATCYKTA